MNDNEFDLAARAWLDDGPTRMSDRAVPSALEEIHTTRQRRRHVAGVEGNTCEHLRPRCRRRGPRGRGRPPGHQPRSAPAGPTERRRPVTVAFSDPAARLPEPDEDLRLAEERLPRSSIPTGSRSHRPSSSGVSEADRRRFRCHGDRLGRGLQGRVHGVSVGHGNRLRLPAPIRTRSIHGSTSHRRTTTGAAGCLAASKRRSPSMGSRARSRSVRTGSRRPSSPAAGSMSSPWCTTAATPGRSSTPLSPRST